MNSWEEHEQEIQDRGSQMDYYIVSQTLLAELSGWDPSTWEIVFYAAWCDYEEYGWYSILRHNGYFYGQGGGHCVMSEDNSDKWDPLPVTQDEALEIMLSWEEHEQEIQDWC